MVLFVGGGSVVFWPPSISAEIVWTRTALFCVAVAAAISGANHIPFHLLLGGVVRRTNTPFRGHVITHIETGAIRLLNEDKSAVDIANQTATLCGENGEVVNSRHCQSPLRGTCLFV